MATTAHTKFVTERDDYIAQSATDESVVLAPALHLRSKVKPLVDHYCAVSSSAEGVNIFNPISSFYRLRRLRKIHSARIADAQALLADCTERFGTPVEGGSPMGMDWIQGFTLAAGLAAFTELNTAVSAASEALDRKSAYAMSVFSLYVALASIVLSLIG